MLADAKGRGTRKTLLRGLEREGEGEMKLEDSRRSDGVCLGERDGEEESGEGEGEGEGERWLWCLGG